MKSRVLQEGATLRVFVSEFVCGGGWHDPSPAGSLAIEGRAMLSAVVNDFLRIAGVEVDTTWDARLGEPPFRQAYTTCIGSPAAERIAFRRLASRCDATLVIAPEFQGILSERCRIVEDAGGRLLGPSSQAARLCSDKLRLAAHLEETGIETIGTRLVDWNQLPSPPPRDPPEFPMVVKPRDGAGSQHVFVVNDADELMCLKRELTLTDQTEFIAQPFVAGAAVSVALVLSPSLRNIEVFVPARQHLSDDGRLRYQGGRIPFDEIDHTAIQQAARSACRSIPGMRGYVGVDLIVPDAAPDRPVVVEINPRLTTSYLGYRQLTDDNLAEWMIDAGKSAAPIRWRAGTVAFDLSGRMTFSGRVNDSAARSKAM